MFREVALGNAGLPWTARMLTCRPSPKVCFCLLLIKIDWVAGKAETTGMCETGKPERHFQFSLRKVLLWTLFVALTFSILSPLGFDDVGWLFVFGWFVAVLVLRWSFGSTVAVAVSMAAGMLLFAWGAYFVSANVRPSYGGATLVGGSMGGIIGLILFLFVEGTRRTIDWLDRIGQTDG